MSRLRLRSSVAWLIVMAAFAASKPAGGAEKSDRVSTSVALARRAGPCPGAVEHSLPLPSTVPPAGFVDFEKQVLAFLDRGEHKRLGWCTDKGGVRDTGPFLQGVYYGPHPAVKVYYSPDVIAWLTAGRPGAIPDGAMIVKEQFSPPAGRYAGLADDQLPPPRGWTVMIKDSQGAKDGWFWGDFFPGMTFDDDQFPFQYPWASFGQTCVRCHATAEKELTFAALANIKGFAGQPLHYEDDGSWRVTSSDVVASSHGRRMTAQARDTVTPDPSFLQTFPSIPAVSIDAVQKLLSETYDHVVPPPGEASQFISSTQCMSCHAALSAPLGPVMFLTTGPPVGNAAQGANVSPYGEWRWSPMGLAGRDPIFYAQLESEFAYFKTLPSPRAEQVTTEVRNTCLTCHGAMGKRQLDADSGGRGDFQLDFLRITDRGDQHFKYGALARDGISCAVCHRAVPDRTPPGITPLEYFLTTAINGRFQVGPPDQIYGPFADDTLVPYAMQTAIGITPRFSPYIQSPRLCGSCHTIDLPVVDGQPGQTSIEQATYLEWLNSQYQTEFGLPGPNARTCQGCHMPRSYHSAKKGLDVPKLEEKIAIISDETYPEAEHQVPLADITVKPRADFSRHELLGLNVFLLEMFRQFNDVLGVRHDDYMSTSRTDLPDAIDNAVQQAQERTARIAVDAGATGASQIQADVAVTNLAGHRLPSGVGFRRVFIELVVVDHQGQVVWASGRTNQLGIIVDGDGRILPSEFFESYTDAQGQTQQHYQPHHEVITRQDQVQIYEELVRNADGRFTTNFTRRVAIVKDNRLLPIGWTERGPDPSLNGRFLQATHPEGSAANDPDYHDGHAGTDHLAYQITLPPGVDASRCRVRATLYSQSIPPSYLDDRFRATPDGEATRRLHFLTSSLSLTGRPAESWKLPLTSTSAGITSTLARER